MRAERSGVRSRCDAATTAAATLLHNLSANRSVLRSELLPAGAPMLPRRGALLSSGSALLQRWSRLLPERPDVQEYLRLAFLRPDILTSRQTDDVPVSRSDLNEDAEDARIPS
jgi:hypothetical protein